MADALITDHIITIQPMAKKVIIHWENIILGISNNVLKMYENNYDPVIYIPFEDISTTHLVQSDFTSYCPFKGDASYWNLVKNGRILKENIAWQYKNPIDDVREIKDHLCFYKDIVSLITQ